MSYAFDTLGKKQVISATCVANTAGTLNSKYLVIYGPSLVGGLLNYESNSVAVVVWFNSDGTGVQPTVAGANRYIAVAVASGDSAATAATKTAAAIAADPAFLAESVNETVIVTATIAGLQTAPDAGTSGFAVSILQAGDGGFPTQVVDGYHVEAADPVLAANGKLYCAVYGHDLLIIDPATQSWEKVDISGVVPTDDYAAADRARWAGNVLAPNGKIYQPPYYANSVLVIDPSKANNDPALVSFIAGIGSDTEVNVYGRYVGTVLVGNKIYCAPMDEYPVLVIDTANDTTYTIENTNIAKMTIDTELGPVNGWKWGFGALGIDGKCYFAPHVDCGLGILVVDPTTDTISFLNHPTGNAQAGDGQWWGMAASGGKLYAVPYGATNVLVIDTNTAPATRSTITVSGLTAGGPEVFGSYAGAVPGADGRIYAISLRGTFVTVIDPSTAPATITTSEMTGLGGASKWGGGALANDGYMYTAPYYSSVIGKIGPYVPEATISPAPGTYSGTQTITLSRANYSGGSIYYTLDGSAPTTASTEYTSPFELAASATVKVLAVDSGVVEGAVQTAAYVITAGSAGAFTLPSVSLQPVILAPSLAAFIPASFTMPSIQVQPIIIPPSLVALASSGHSIRSPSGELLDLRTIDGVPIQIGTL